MTVFLSRSYILLQVYMVLCVKNVFVGTRRDRFVPLRIVLPCAKVKGNNNLFSCVISIFTISVDILLKLKLFHSPYYLYVLRIVCAASSVVLYTTAAAGKIIITLQLQYVYKYNTILSLHKIQPGLGYGNAFAEEPGS